MAEEILFQCGRLLIERQLTVAFAESASAGRMMAEFALVPEAGKFLKGGLVCYDAGLKEQVLKVPKELVEQYTPESEPVTMAIAKGLTNIVKADIYIAVTGLTAPGGSETKEKPVGTMFIYAEQKGRTLFNERTVFKGSPEEIIMQSVSYTAALLLTALA